MDGFIPKEKLTAYERWELAAFDEAEQLAAKAQTPAQKTAPAEPAPLPDGMRLPLPTPEEIEGLRADARAVGRAEGHAEGLAAGRREAIQQVQAEAARLQRIAADLQGVLAQAEDRFADQVLALALDVARQVLRTGLKVKPELLLPAVREAMSLITSQHGHPTLFLPRQDAELVRTHLGEQLGHSGWRIIDDPALGRGDCRVENAGSEIDATMATRWRRVVEGIGARSDWLETDP